MMVGITLIMSTVVLAIALSFQLPVPAPMASIFATPEYSTPGVLDISITHKGGNGLVAGDWWMSVVPAGSRAIYKQSSTNFTVGDEINTRIVTGGTGDYTVTRSLITTNGIAAPISGGSYDVSIIVQQYEIMHVTVVVNG